MNKAFFSGIFLLMLFSSCYNHDKDYSSDSEIDSLITVLNDCKKEKSTFQNIFVKYDSIQHTIKLYQDSISTINIRYSNSKHKAIKYKLIQDYIYKLDLLILADSILIEQITSAKSTGIDSLILNVLINDINMKIKEIAQLKKENEKLKEDLRSLGIIIKELEIDTSKLKKRIVSVIEEKDSVKKEFVSARRQLEQKEYEILLLKRIPVSDINVKHRSKKNETQICFNLEENTSADQGMKDIYIIVKDPSNIILTRKNDTFISKEDGIEEWLSYTISTQKMYSGQKINKFCVAWLHNFDKMTLGKYHVSIFIDGLEVGQTDFYWKE